MDPLEVKIYVAEKVVLPVTVIPHIPAERGVVRRSNYSQHLHVRKCRLCGEEKEKDKFLRNRDTRRGSIDNDYMYYMNVCLDCNSVRRANRYKASIDPDSRAAGLERLRIWKNKIRGTMEGWVYSNLHRWRKRSAVVGVNCDLTIDNLMTLWDKQRGMCYYTGVELSPVHRCETKSRKQLSVSQRCRNSPSLDRLFPDRGYVISNVVWCCFGINSMKGDLTKDAFIELCGDLAKRFALPGDDATNHGYGYSSHEEGDLRNSS